MTLVNVYVPSNDDNPEFFNTLFNKVEQVSNDTIIMGGDWNVVLDMKLDVRNYLSTARRPRSRKMIIDLMSKNDMVDIFRYLHPTKRKYTWRKFNTIKQGRLDYFLITSDLISEVTGAEIGASYRSDHSLVHLTLRKEAFKRDKQFWKFNNSLLKDKMFVDEIKSVILTLKREYASLVYDLDNIHSIPNEDLQLRISDQLFFEMLLLKIREKSISYSCHKKKVDTDSERKLQEQIDCISENLCEDNLDQLEHLKIQLNELRDKKVQGMIIRSRIKWIQNGEKPSKYFCNLENRNFVDKTMSFLEKTNGTVVSDQKDILLMVEHFYKQLYSKRGVEDVNIDELISNANKLTDEEKNLLEGPISYTESCQALRNMKNDKSPGSDGFTIEFF